MTQLSLGGQHSQRAGKRFDSVVIGHNQQCRAL
jgi:hypothetical protein